MPASRILALVVSTSLVAGCAVGSDYLRPDAPLAEQYTGQAAMDARTATTTANFEVWWEGFGDPQLSALISKALDQNLDITQAQARVAQARVAQARAGLGAANAALLPSATINGQAARAYQSVETPLGQVLDATPGYERYGNSYEANLNASWESVGWIRATPRPSVRNTYLWAAHNSDQTSRQSPVSVHSPA